jgi:outer membrane lipoprotein-sorting protein
MLSMRFKSFLLFGILLAATLPACAVSELESQSDLAPALTANIKWGPGQSAIDKVHSQIQTFQDYVFDSALAVNTGEKIKTDLGHFYFKKNKRVRVDCKSGGVNKGAVVVRTEDGKVRAAGGGMLKFMKMNLEPDSRMLILANGYNVINSDFLGLLDTLQKRMAGCQAFVTADVVKEERNGTPCRVIEIRKGSTPTDRIIVGAADMVPLEWDLYKDGAIYSIVKFENFKANIGLSDSLFNL